MTNVRESQLSAGFAGKSWNRGALRFHGYGIFAKLLISEHMNLITCMELTWEGRTKV